MAADPWPGNPASRVHESAAGMIHPVGLQGKGVAFWLEHELPVLLSTGARVVASIWGTTVEDYGRAAELLADAPAQVVAVEVNLSCPNVHRSDEMFAHNPGGTAAALEAASVCGRPLWAKLSPNVTDLGAIARAAQEAGASAVTLVNTVMGLVIDTETRRPVLGKGKGGLSGRAIHPVAVRAVWDVCREVPGLPIVGVGGIASGKDAIEMIMAGASAIQVGTATFADPRAVQQVQDEVVDWCRQHGVRRIDELIGVAHG